MTQKIIQKSGFRVLVILATLLFATAITWAQTDTTPKKRLKSPATAKGSIGGEGHDSYVIRARNGQTMTVQISWRNKDDNKAEFTVSNSANFFNSEKVKFGKESNKGRSWVGNVPKTENYYIYVVAHPAADYTLKVTVK